MRTCARTSFLSTVLVVALVSSVRAETGGHDLSRLLKPATEQAREPAGFQVRLDIVSEGYDGKTCWFHPRAGAIPGGTPTVVLTMQKLNVKRSDVFYPIAPLESSDLGRTWSPIVGHTQTLGRHPFGNNCEEGICDFTPKWHAQSGKLLATGHTVVYSWRSLEAGFISRCGTTARPISPWAPTGCTSASRGSGRSMTAQTSAATTHRPTG